MPEIYHEPIPVTATGAGWYALGRVLTHPAVRAAIESSVPLSPAGMIEFQATVAAIASALARSAGMADPFAH